jgi:hypothetical protein
MPESVFTFMTETSSTHGLAILETEVVRDLQTAGQVATAEFLDGVRRMTANCVHIVEKSKSRSLRDAIALFRELREIFTPEVVLAAFAARPLRLAAPHLECREN